ncbi:hypothetical protein MHYP_G00274940 [Metynnis hypsauchen]
MTLELLGLDPRVIPNLEIPQGREQNGTAHNGPDSGGDLTSPVPHQRTKLAPPSVAPPSIPPSSPPALPRSSPPSRAPPQRVSVLPKPELSRLAPRTQDGGQRSDSAATANGEPGVTVGRTQSFQGRKPPPRVTTATKDAESDCLKGRPFVEKSSICRPPTRPPDPPTRFPANQKAPSDETAPSYVASKTKFFENASRQAGSPSVTPAGNELPR